MIIETLQAVDKIVLSIWELQGARRIAQKKGFLCQEKLLTSLIQISP